MTFITAPKNVKHLEINLKMVQNIYGEYYESLFRNIKEDLNKRRVIPCSLTG